MRSSLNFAIAIYLLLCIIVDSKVRVSTFSKQPREFCICQFMIQKSIVQSVNLCALSCQYEHRCLAFSFSTEGNKMASSSCTLLGENGNDKFDFHYNYSCFGKQSPPPASMKIISESELCTTTNAFKVKYSISVKKSTMQSSSHPTYCSSIAVDGIRTEFTHTALDIKAITPWWRVDLNGSYHITGVSLRPRNERSLVDRMHDFEIRVGNFDPVGIPHNTLITQNALCYSHPDGGLAVGRAYDYTCAKSLVGRYVTVQIIKLCPKCKDPHENILSLSALDVYGCPM